MPPLHASRGCAAAGARRRLCASARAAARSRVAAQPPRARGRVVACASPPEPPPTLRNLDAVLGTPATPPAPPPPPPPPTPLPVVQPSRSDMWAPFAVPWDWPVLLGAMAGVEACFLGAGLLAPLIVLSASSTDLSHVTDTQLVAFLSSPEQFWRILLTAELCVAACVHALVRAGC